MNKLTCQCGNILRAEQSSNELCDACCYCDENEVGNFTVAMILKQSFYNTTKKKLLKDLYEEGKDIYSIQDFHVGLEKV